MVLVEDLGEKSREDDIGISACEILINQVWMFVEEFLAASAVVGQHELFLKPSPHRNSDYRRQKSPSRAAVDMQYVVAASHTKQSHWEQQAL